MATTTITNKQAGASLIAVGGALQAVPVVGTFAGAAVAMVGIYESVFGEDYKTSSKVRWLVGHWEYYVGSNQIGLSDHSVNENDTVPAWNWYLQKLGVPVYDDYRLHALKGTDVDSGLPLNRSYFQRALDYLAFPDVQQAGVTNDDAMKAVLLAENLNWFDAAGQQVAGSWSTAPDAVKSDLVVTGAGGSTQVSLKPNIVNSILSSPWYIIELIAAAVIVIFFLIPKKNK